MPFWVASLPCENGIAERPQTLRYPEIKIIFPLIMRKANAERILNHPTQKRPPHLCLRWSFLRLCDRS